MIKKLLLTFVLIFSGFYAAFSYTGEAEPQMLKMIYGTRAMSLGGAYAGLADDIYYADANPAGGDVRNIYKISILHQEWIADVNYEAVRVTRGFLDRFYLGLGFTYLYLPFEHYDIFGENIGNYTLSQSLGLLNFGYAFKKYNLAVGANLKFYYNHVPEKLIEGQSYFIFVTDIGVIAKTNYLKRYTGPDPSLVLGLTLKNLGSSKEVEKLPTEIHMGASYRFLHNLMFSTELVIPFYEPIYGAVGAEYDFAKKYFIEGGIQIKQNPMFALGFGYKWKSVLINISYTPSINFYNMFGVSFTYSFQAKGSKDQK